MTEKERGIDGWALVVLGLLIFTMSGGWQMLASLF
jgi:hypothetical protein